MSLKNLNESLITSSENFAYIEFFHWFDVLCLTLESMKIHLHGKLFERNSCTIPGHSETNLFISFMWKLQTWKQAMPKQKEVSVSQVTHLNQ